MSDLLSIGRSGVLAYQGALQTVGENVTNADTTGYSRRSVVLTEAAANSGATALSRTSSAFGGVNASQVSRVWDQYRATNAWSADSDANGASTRLQYLQTVQSMLDDSDSGVGTKLSAVFTSATQLSANPTDTSLRQTMIASIGDAAGAIATAGANLAKVADTVRTQAITVADQTNSQLAALAKLNVALHTSPQGSAARAQLEDQRDNLIGTISQNIAVDVTFASDGSATLKLGNYSGPTLLASTGAAPAYLSVSTASDGRLALKVADGGTTTTATTPTGGVLAGLVDSAATIAGRRSQIDALANKFATQINAWQANGTTVAGAAGQPLLTGTTAATLALATTDPSAIAAADGTTDNGNLLALSNLRGTDGVESAWSSIVSGQALAVSTATTESTASSARRDSAQSSLDEVTGIDLDTEAAELLRYQQAYSASAKIIQTARDTLQTVLQLF